MNDCCMCLSKDAAHSVVRGPVAGAAPPMIYLGIDNTLALERGPLAHCRVTLYAPYWLDNRTGMDLSFKDAPLSGRLFGVRSRFDYNEVVACGEPTPVLGS